jgi:hypothetical protein
LLGLRIRFDGVPAWRRLYEEGVLDKVDESNSYEAVERGRIERDILCTGGLVD